MPTVLIVEDERDLADLLDFNFRKEGFATRHASTGAEALAIAREHGLPDLVLLDLMLPDIPGTDICRELRRQHGGQDVGIIMVTARGEEIDRVVGFEVGADDYVVKPFSVRELVLRARSLLRRGQREASDGIAVRFGEMRIDRQAHRLWVDEHEIELTALEFRLLNALYHRRGKVQTRDVLLEDVWGMDGTLTTRTVDTHVKRLREKLGSAARFVETVRGVGYRFATAPTARDA